MSKWDELTMAEKAEMIGVAVRNGITNLQDIREKYNEFAEGGSKGEEEEVNTIVPFTQKTEVVITPDTEYNQYLNTLPDNQRFTPNDAYDSYLYWKLNEKPRNFREAYDKGMFTWDSSDNGYHANSIAFGDDGVGYFMKPKTHDTVGFETDWYNKGLVIEEGGTQRPMTPEERAEWLNFRSQYNLIDDPDRPNFYRYEPKNKHSLGGPLVEAAMNEYRKGGGIHIKPENRGKFTALKKRTGHSATWFKQHGTPAQRKMATFALNARKWKHGLGGNLFGGISQPTQQMQIGLNVQGWPSYTTEQIIAYGEENARRRKAIQDAYLNFITESNDATAVASDRPQNQHLVDRAVRGAKAHAAWEKEHPNLTAWSYLPSAAVIGTALAPLGAAGWSGLTALGDAAAATSTGQAITAGLSPLATAASTSVAGAPLYTWADVGLSSLFGEHGIQTAIDEKGISPMTALEIAPLGRLAKPMFNAVTRFSTPLNTKPMKGFLTADDYYDIPDFSTAGLPDFSTMTRAEKYQWLKTQQGLAQRVDQARTMDALRMTKDRLRNGGFDRLKNAAIDDVTEVNPEAYDVTTTSDNANAVLDFLNNSKKEILKARPYRGTSQDISKKVGWQLNAEDGALGAHGNFFTNIFKNYSDFRKSLGLTKGNKDAAHEFVHYMYWPFSRPKGFHFFGPNSDYFSGASMGIGSGEIAARGTQLKNYFGLKEGEILTPEMWSYAQRHYIKDVGDNVMSDMFNSVNTKSPEHPLFLQWLNKHAPSIVGTGLTTSTTLKFLDNE